MDTTFIEFNKLFPDSKYREVQPQYTGPMETDEDISNYQHSKAPIGTAILDFEAIKNTKNRVGWIVPPEYVVVDVDNKIDAKYVFKVLTHLNTKFMFMTGRKGGHFIFKNNRDIGKTTKKMTSIGIPVDTMSQNKAYIILPVNDTDRKWGTITTEVDTVPFCLTPLKSFKTDMSFIELGEGDGRNDALLRHFLALKDYAPELTLEEQIESIKIINTVLFKKALSEKELQNTVLRKDIVEKESEVDKGPETEEDDERYCMEEALARKILKQNKIINTNEDWYIYNGKYYRKLHDMIEIERIIHANYKSNLKEKQRKETIKFIKLKSWVPTNKLNKNWNEIVFKNGVLNISDGKMYPHTPDEYNTIYIDTNYNPNAEYSQIIDNFFNQISDRKEDKKALLYEIVGYCLIRKSIFDKFFIAYGEGSTGKSTYLKLIKNLIGANNASFLSLNDLEHTFMPAELFNKLINIGDDIAYKGLKETDILKKLVTGEMFAAQQKFKQQPLNFSNFAKLIFTTNKLPEIYDRSTGFYRRFSIISINKKIENPDPFFLDKLIDKDYEYLLMKGVEYVKAALKRNALTVVEDSEIAIADFRTNQSSVLSFLKDYSYDADKLELRPAMEVFKEYEFYCNEVGFKNLKKVNFDNELAEILKMEKKNTTVHSENLTYRWVKCKKYL